MLIIKIIYFLFLALYVIQCFVAKKMVFNWGVILTAVALHAFYFFGWPGLFFLCSVAVISTIAELISLKTPLNVFGVSYKYDLQHELFPSRVVIGKVLPLEVTCAWVLLKYLTLFLISYLLLPLGVHELAKITISALVLVTFDLILDPYYVTQGAWTWSRRGRLFGIPWQNFFGWFVVGFIISLLFRNLVPIQAFEGLMVMPVIIVCALFPMILGGQLLAINKSQALMAMAPLITLILASLFVLTTPR